MKYLLLPIIRLISVIDYFYRQLTQLVISYPYKRIGKCKQCGQCCKAIMFELDPRWLKIKAIRDFAINWNIYFNNLRFLEYQAKQGYLFFTCNYLSPEGKCLNYYWRPWFCREYPRGFSYFVKPPTLPGCGFKFTSEQK